MWETSRSEDQFVFDSIKKGIGRKEWLPAGALFYGKEIRQTGRKTNRA